MRGPSSETQLGKRQGPASPRLACPRSCMSFIRTLLQQTMLRQPPPPSRAQLVHQLETVQKQLANLDGLSAKQAPTSRKPPKNGPLPASLALAPKRHIALRFAYDGWAHSGLAWQAPTAHTPFTTDRKSVV